MKKLTSALAAALFLSLMLGIVLGPAGGLLAPISAKAIKGLQDISVPMPGLSISEPSSAPVTPTPIPTEGPGRGGGAPGETKRPPMPEPTKKPDPQPSKRPFTGGGQKVMNNEGPLFLSFQTDLTKELLMFTPMDLSLEGEMRMQLIGNADQVVGEAKVAVQSGMVIVSYLVAGGVKVDEKNEFFTLFPDIRTVPSVEPGKLQEMKLKFGIPYNVASFLNSDSNVLLYINTPVSYKTNQAGLISFSFADPVYLEKMMALLPLMD